MVCATQISDEAGGTVVKKASSVIQLMIESCIYNWALGFLGFMVLGV